jgi:peroxiredoxin family protein
MMILDKFTQNCSESNINVSNNNSGSNNNNNNNNSDNNKESNASMWRPLSIQSAADAAAGSEVAVIKSFLLMPSPQSSAFITQLLESNHCYSHSSSSSSSSSISSSFNDSDSSNNITSAEASVTATAAPMSNSQSVFYTMADSNIFDKYQQVLKYFEITRPSLPHPDPSAAKTSNKMLTDGDDDEEEEDHHIISTARSVSEYFIIVCDDLIDYTGLVRLAVLREISFALQLLLPHHTSSNTNSNDSISSNNNTNNDEDNNSINNYTNSNTNNDGDNNNIKNIKNNDSINNTNNIEEEEINIEKRQVLAAVIPHGLSVRVQGFESFSLISHHMVDPRNTFNVRNFIFETVLFIEVV